LVFKIRFSESSYICLYLFVKSQYYFVAATPDKSVQVLKLSERWHLTENFSI